MSWRWALLLSLVCGVGCDRGGGIDPDPGPTPNTRDMGGEEMSVPGVEIPTGPMTGRTAMRLLTRYEYDNTVEALLGLSSSEAQNFPPENSADGFENNAWVHKVNPTTLRYYMEASERLAERAAAAPPEVLKGCVPVVQEATVDASVCKQGLEGFLKLAFRRPVYEDEVAIIHDLYDAQLAEEGSEQALRVSVQAVLQAPQFLYRLELYEPSGQALEPRDGEMDSEDFEPVGPYEMASRLSYFFWGTMPDAELMALAEQGTLNTPEVLKAQVKRLFSDARAKEMVHQFNRQWLGLARLDTLSKDKAFYPAWRMELREDFRLSLEAFVDHAYWEEGTFNALMTSNAVYLTESMAPIYGQEVQAASGGMWRVDFPETERKGLITQPALLSILAYANQSSPIARAVFVREKLFCQHLPPPPSDRVITPPDPAPGLTTRETFAIHTEEKVCAGCHTLIDPLGFGMEDYDGMGRKRSMEKGKAIDSSGELVGSPDVAVNGPFDGGANLAEKIAGSDVIAACLAQQWFTFAMGRQNDASDEASIARILETFEQSGRRFESLFEAIVLSDSFRFRKKKSVADSEAMQSAEEKKEEER